MNPSIDDTAYSISFKKHVYGYDAKYFTKNTFDKNKMDTICLIHILF